jgi:hypothetical protein
MANASRARTTKRLLKSVVRIIIVNGTVMKVVRYALQTCLRRVGDVKRVAKSNAYPHVITASVMPSLEACLSHHCYVACFLHASHLGT